METFNAYTAWFQNIFQCFCGRVVLIPDTNFLVNCYYSNYLKDIIQQNKDRVSFSISHLTLFEIERQINEFSKIIISNEKSLKEKKNSEKKDEIEKSLTNSKKKKRLKFQAIGEISEMIKDGADILPTLNDNFVAIISQSIRWFFCRFMDKNGNL